MKTKIKIRKLNRERTSPWKKRSVDLDKISSYARAIDSPAPPSAFSQKAVDAGQKLQWITIKIDKNGDAVVVDGD